MQRAIILPLLILLSFNLMSQDLSAYAFARTPKLVDYNFQNSTTTYSQGVSAGLGLTHKRKFLELGTFILDGNSYGYYTFFGFVISSVALKSNFKLNTNWFGEVTNLPAQSESDDVTWIYTTGVCLFPNLQVQRFNIGIPLCVGIAKNDIDLLLNNRFILNLSYAF